MKNSFTISIIALLFLLGACTIREEGPIGPQGQQGVQGPQGIQGIQGESGFVMEWESVNFTAPNYEVILPYSDFGFEGFNSDVALTYLLWGTEDINGETVEIWRKLQQTILTTDGILQYNYDFTKYDIRLFLDANYNLDLLTAIDTDAWVVRVVVVPGEFWNNGGRFDVSNYHEVAEALGLPEIEREPKSKITRRVN